MYSSIMLLTVIVAVLLHSCNAQQEQVRMTILGLNPFRSEFERNSQYQCHLSAPDFTRRDDGITVESFRAGRTRPSESDNPDPPSPVFQHSNTYPNYRVELDNNGNNDGFGVFGCRVTKEGKLETAISTVRMRSDADIRPANGLFTQTVNIGEEGVNIRMESSTKNVQNFIWRHNNSAKMQIGSDTYYINEPIQLSHAGIYECHADGERDLAKHGLNLLLVRACAAYRWGPPACNGVCDSCYNGGICDENNGKCICPPGFMGDNCLTACGGNRYGHICEKRCSSRGNAASSSCRGNLFCLVHPFGCRCNSGWKGLACNTECVANTFGASCEQSCHCASNRCNRYTGRCTGTPTGCKSGWTGDNCQECDGNYFGADCSQECHCSKDLCNVGSAIGLCKPGGCLPQWVDLYPPYSCQTGLQNMTYTKVNAGASAMVTCTAVEGPGGGLNSLNLFLSRDVDRLEQDGITVLDDGATKMQTFMVASVEEGDTFYCQLRDNSGDKQAVFGPLTVEVFDLPMLTLSPVNQSVSVTSVSISWSAWDNTRDIGDPPVVGYVPYYKKTEEDDWLRGDMLSSETLMYTFTGLDADASYSFSVAAVREGDGGEGQRSPLLNVTTMCKVPPSPQNVMTETEENIVTISWQIPTDDITCSSGIIKFTIYYFSSETDLTSVDVIDPTATSFILSNLTTTDSYTFYMTLTTAGGLSKESDKIGHSVPGSSSAVAAVFSVIAVLFVALVAIVVVLLLKRRRMNSNRLNRAVCDKSGSTNNAYRSTTDVRTQERFSQKDAETEGEDEEEEDQTVYTNVEKPVSILIANLEKYIRDCENSKTANLEQQFLLLNGGKQFESHVGSKEENRTKNRFRNMVAYDHSRVVLEVIDGDPHSDYYNANYITNVEEEVAFIAGQGPNRASVNDFWRMVLMTDVHHIVMLTNLIEGGKDRCNQYWPPAVGDTKRFGKIEVRLEREECFGDYDIRELYVEMGEESHKVTNWHFRTWPDKDIPDQASPLIEFANKVKSFQQTSPGPLLVHCSAGVGRTGTFIALYSLTDAMKYSTRIDIYGFVEQMRQNRIRMVQTELQYKFLHECLLEAYVMGDTKIPVDSMESIDFNAEKDKLKKQFKLLAKLNQRSAKPHTATTEETEKSRYPEILPVDRNRPFLQCPGKISFSSYINACIVSSYRKKNAFIATQSPLPDTVEDFWRLVYDWSSPLIVMLNQLDPHDKTCCKYWPESGSSQFGHMIVELKDELNMSSYIYRQFDVTHSIDQETRSVFHMQLTSWDTNNLEDIMSLISDMGKLQQDYSMVTPTVVHCINGAGRTGVFLAVKSEMERLSAEGSFDVFTTVRKLRGSNPSMVYTEEDYYLCHQLLKLEFPESQYANI